jgi:hypothetical protein
LIDDFIRVFIAASLFTVHNHSQDHRQDEVVIAPRLAHLPDATGVINQEGGVGSCGPAFGTSPARPARDSLPHADFVLEAP